MVKAVAHYHTHGDADKGDKIFEEYAAGDFKDPDEETFKDNQFSDQDINNYLKQKIDGYVGTPMGNIYKFDYKKYKEVIENNKTTDRKIMQATNIVSYKELTDTGIVTRLCKTISDPKLKK